MNRKLTKIAALGLSICYVLQMNFTVYANGALQEETFAEETAEAVVSNEVQTTVPKAIELETGFLDALGMIPENIGFDSAVTREEAAVLICEMLACESLAQSYSDISYYNDVSLYSESLGYINVVTNEGFFSGRGDGIFAPQEPITYNEFAKILVMATGYGVKAENSGGYPQWYMGVAAQLKILHNTSGTGNGAVTWGDAIKMVFEAMQVEILEVSSYTSTGDFTIEKSQEGTILSLNHGIYIDKGQITGTSVSRMFGAGSSEELESGEIEIDGNLFCYDAEKLTNIKEHTGYSVEYFFRKKENSRYEYELVYAHAKNNKTVTLGSYEILEVFGFNSGEGGTPYVKFRRDGELYKSEKISIDKNTALIVNDVGIPRITNEALFPGTGRVTFIDSDNNNVYDVAVVLNYDTRVVDTVSIHGKYIYFKANSGEDQTALKPLMLNSDFSNVTYELTQDGKPISLRDIKENDIIGILESERDDVTHYRIELISSAFEGTITEIGDREALVDGKTYKINENFSPAEYEISLNEKCLLYLNYADEIFRAEKIVTEYEFQYLLLGAATTRSIGGNVQIKVVYAPHFHRHNVEILDLAERVKVNGKTLRGSAIVDALKISAEDRAQLATVLEKPTEFMQPIRSMEFDSEGKVIKIDILPEGAVSTVADRTYKGEGPYNEAFDDYKISYLTQFFYVPKSCLDEDWVFGELERLKFDSAYSTMMWGSDDEGLPEVVFVFHNETTANANYKINQERPMLVDGVKTRWDSENDETIHCITTYNTGGVFVYESDSRNASNQRFDELRPGDIIYAALTQLETETIAKVNVILGGNMWDCQKVISLSDKSLSYYKASRQMYGIVDTIRIDVRKNKCVLNMYFGEDDGYQSYDISGVPIYYFDRGEKKAMLASYAAVRSREYFGDEGASNVFVWLDEDLDPAMIVIVGEK